MIRMIQSTSAAHAKKYFSDALAKGDYYLGSENQELRGFFTGRLAERLGITGPAEKEIFYKLCDNINPITGRNLTPYSKEERTTGYDINFHLPKSVSLLHALSEDGHILKCFEQAVSATLEEIEADSMTRVRKGGKNEDRKTGELVAAVFYHQTSRPVGDMPPDPHMHCHAYVFNATYDPVEDKIKAGQFRNIKRDMPYYQARFQKRMSDGLIDLGYDIRVTDSAYEILGTPESVIRHFSKRTDEIGQVAKDLGITDPELLSELGARTRAKKQTGLSMKELKKEWRRQINEEIAYADGEMDAKIRYADKSREALLSVKDCVDHSIDHSFERASVIQDRRLMSNAIKHSIGERQIEIAAIEMDINSDKRLICVQQNGLNYLTTTAVLAEEREMVNLARKGQGRFRPIYTVAPDIKLEGEQKEAVNYLLTNPHQTNILRGVAGAGKTTSLKELDRLIQTAGKKVFFVTPLAKSAREQMPADGFENTETVAKLLSDRTFQKNLENQVLVVDEAGQLGVKDMTALLRLADEKNFRVIYCGDTRQHNATLRGDGLRVINTIGQIPAAEVSKIYRQRSNPQYLAAVKHLSEGNIEDGFEKLDEMGAIKTVDPLKPNKGMVSAYVDAVKRGETVLAVSPTRKQGRIINNEIRAEMQKAGKIGRKDIVVNRLENLNFTDAEKTDWRKYRPGHVIQFNQNVPQIKRGSVWHLIEVDETGLVIKNADNTVRSLPLQRANAFQVYQQRQIALAKGDKLKITNGGFDLDDRRLSNGQSMEVRRIAKDGTLHLRNPVSKTNYRIGSGFGHIDHDYCSTSHSAQGRTVDTVIISQPADTFSATDAKQFYVSCSRGKQAISIFTDDKDKLLEHALHLGNRTSALELVGERIGDNEYVVRAEMENRLKNRPRMADKALPVSAEKDYLIDEYEPRI